MSPAADQANRLIEQGRLEQARSVLTRALSKTPRDPDALMAMCYVCAKTGDRSRALYFAELCAAVLPDDPRVLMNLAQSRLDAGRDAEAVTGLLEVLARMDGEERMFCQLSHALAKTGRFVEAAQWAARGLEKHPDSTSLLINQAAAAIVCGDAAQSVRCCRRAVEIDPTNPVALSNLLSAINYCDLDVQRDAVARGEVHAKFGRLMAERHGPANFEWAVTPDPDRPLRVGLLSPDLRLHAVSYFAEPVLRHHDRREWTLIAYSTANPEDARTDALRPLAAEWRRLSGMAYADIARMMQRDRIDVLIDLAGHTNGNALPVLHLKPAPVQMTWVGYPHSTGVPSVDYRIVDRITDPPPPEGRWLCVEKPLYLDPCFLMWEPAAGVPEPAPCPPIDERGVATFGSFTAVQKMSDATVRLWAGVLSAVSGSRLWIKTTSFKDERVRDLIRERFVRAGVAAERLQLDPPGANALEMMRLYAQMDVALDTFPYHGTTTTCECLWMGVPIVTLEGPRDAGIPASRVSCSIIRAVCGDQAERLIAVSEDDYVAKAAALASDAARLRAWRGGGAEGLRTRMAASPIRDGAGRCRQLEAEVRRCWRAWCQTRR